MLVNSKEGGGGGREIEWEEGREGRKERETETENTNIGKEKPPRVLFLSPGPCQLKVPLFPEQCCHQRRSGLPESMGEYFTFKP